MRVENFITDDRQQQLIDLMETVQDIAMRETVHDTLLAIETGNPIPASDLSMARLLAPIEIDSYLAPKRQSELLRLHNQAPASAVRLVIREVITSHKSGTPTPAALPSPMSSFGMH